jgi:hypothetical protein
MRVKRDELKAVSDISEILVPSRLRSGIYQEWCDLGQKSQL